MNIFKLKIRSPLLYYSLNHDFLVMQYQIGRQNFLDYVYIPLEFKLRVSGSNKPPSTVALALLQQQFDVVVVLSLLGQTRKISHAMNRKGH